jgi:hypothetical protein
MLEFYRVAGLQSNPKVAFGIHSVLARASMPIGGASSLCDARLGSPTAATQDIILRSRLLQISVFHLSKILP